MTGEELAKQIEESGLTEEELEPEGWGRVCGNLPGSLAEAMKKQNPARVKIVDALSPYRWLILEYGYKSYIQKEGEYDLEEGQAKENKDKVSDKAGQSLDRKTTGQVSDRPDNPSAGSRSWFDL